MAGRRRKRYGPVHNRAVRVAPWQKLGGEPPSPAVRRYAIPAGTAVEVRRLGGGEGWRPHVTSRDITCYGFLWRNASHYGFAQGEFEVKAPVGSFRERV